MAMLPTTNPRREKADIIDPLEPIGKGVPRHPEVSTAFRRTTRASACSLLNLGGPT
jgi:hypothetical protein